MLCPQCEKLPHGAEGVQATGGDPVTLQCQPSVSSSVTWGVGKYGLWGLLCARPSLCWVLVTGRLTLSEEPADCVPRGRGGHSSWGRRGRLPAGVRSERRYIRVAHSGVFFLTHLREEQRCPSRPAGTRQLGQSSCFSLPRLIRW